VTDVKICGLTRPEDVALACALGARYVGFNFAAASSRCVDLYCAGELAAAAAPGVARVGVFVDESMDEIRRAVEAGALDVVQIHRPLHARDLQEAPRPVFAVSSVEGARAAPPSDDLLVRCQALLFDTAIAGTAGGTGRVFDWSVVAARRWPVPVILAGGLVSDNVADAIARVQPSGVDVASGVESSPGVKDRGRLERFFDAVRKADEAHARTA
jgi:phosphoribosylanthranilate isomerase